MTRRGFPPALVLFFLAPAVGELVSGSSPPAEFFHPVTLAILAALYGSGAVVIRELALRWRKGWPAILALGAAYGIVEEGLAVKSFFDPNWMDLGILGTYGRWAGVNWVWSLELTVYHAVVSIAIPIALTTLIFPKRRDTPWVGRRGLGWFLGLLAADVIFCSALLTPYRPPAVQYGLATLLAAGLVVLARRLPVREAGPVETPSGAGGRKMRARRFLGLGFLATVLFFIVTWAVPHTGLPFPGTMLLTVALVAGTAGLLRRMTKASGGLSDRNLWALVSGALAFFILLAPLQELDPARAGSTAGMALTGLAALFLLGWIAWRRGFHRKA